MSKNIDAAALSAMIAFVENLATPCSEPLNSAVGYRGLADRKYWMGVIRAEATAVLARVKPA